MWPDVLRHLPVVFLLPVRVLRPLGSPCCSVHSAAPVRPPTVLTHAAPHACPPHDRRVFVQPAKGSVSLNYSDLPGDGPRVTQPSLTIGPNAQLLVQCEYTRAIRRCCLHL